VSTDGLVYIDTVHVRSGNVLDQPVMLPNFLYLHRGQSGYLPYAGQTRGDHVLKQE